MEAVIRLKRMGAQEHRLLEPMPSSICAVPGCGMTYRAHAELQHRFVSSEERMLVEEACGMVSLRGASKALLA